MATGAASSAAVAVAAGSAGPPTTSAELDYLLTKEGVPPELQTRLREAGILTLRHFAGLATDSDGVRTLLREDLGVEPTGLANKVTISKFLAAWESARARSTKMATMEAEAEARREPKPVLTTDFKAMKEAYETKWWALESAQVPNRSYIERISEGIEKGEPRAEPLSEVLNYEEGDTDLMKAIFDSDGSIKAIKTATTVPLPRDAEELRKRINLLGRGWMFVGAQQSSCVYLKDLSPQLFQDYLDYLLGPYVLQLAARDDNGNVSSSPPWKLVLSYEHEIRRKAMRMVEKGSMLKDALREAWNDPLTKERFFTTPLAMQPLVNRGSKRPQPGADGSSAPRRSGPQPQQHQRGHQQQSRKQKQNNRTTKGGGKGSNKGKGKGKNLQGDCNAQTPQGEPICFKYNARVACNEAKCNFMHVCGRCSKRGHTILDNKC